MLFSKLAARARRLAAITVSPLAPGPKFACPVCGFRGVFLAARSPLGARRHALCPRCGALERHRVQKVALDRFASLLPPRARALQISPDPMTAPLRALCAELVTGDLSPKPGSMRLDLRRLALPDVSFDLVFASHVMEHIAEDEAALREVHRVLRPGGVAILPVPIVADRTVEYPFPSPHEALHVRAPGLDYFDRYRTVFGRVEVVTSTDLPGEYQPWIYEDRSIFPNAHAPFRPAMSGDRHSDAVPICIKASGGAHGAILAAELCPPEAEAECQGAPTESGSPLLVSAE